eukprot:Pgem_evm1s2993
MQSDPLLKTKEWWFTEGKLIGILRYGTNFFDYPDLGSLGIDVMIRVKDEFKMLVEHLSSVLAVQTRFLFANQTTIDDIAKERSNTEAIKNFYSQFAPQTIIRDCLAEVNFPKIQKPVHKLTKKHKYPPRYGA